MTAHADGSLWYYAPNGTPAILFANFFAASVIYHICICVKYKSWKLSGVLPWGTAILAAGFITRSVGAYDYDNLGLYIGSTVCLVMGPPVYAAHLYIVLGRVMYYIPWLAPMHPGRVITTFLGLDVICEVILGSGIARVANTSLSATEQKIGNDLVRAGMILQVVMFLFYLALAAHFHVRCAQNGVLPKIRSVMVVLYVTGLLILERSIYRTVEFFQGYKGTIYRTEWLFYVFDGTAMLLVTYILNYWAPARLLPRSNKTYLAMDGVTEREGPGWVDKRPFIVTLFDPFDLGSLCTGRKTNVKFWENDDDLAINNVEAPKYVVASPC